MAALVCVATAAPARAEAPPAAPSAPVVRAELRKAAADPPPARTEAGSGTAAAPPSEGVALPVSSPSAAGAPAATAPVGAGTVNLNTATVEELVRLPGVGPGRAGAICAFRERHGPFKRLDELDRVKGFGRKLIARLRPFVALSGPTTFVGKAHSRKQRNLPAAQPATSAQAAPSAAPSGARSASGS